MKKLAVLFFVCLFVANAVVVSAGNLCILCFVATALPNVHSE